MIQPPACLLYTEDPEFVRRASAYLRTVAPVQHVARLERLHLVLEQHRSSILLFDLRSRESRDLLEQVRRQWPEVLVIGFGVLRSDPFREAEQAGLYAVEDIFLQRRQFQALVRRALDYLRLAEESRALRAEAVRQPAPSLAGPLEIAQESSYVSLALQRFPRLFQRRENSDLLADQVVEGLSEATRVRRVGMFGRRAPGESFRLRAGLRCLPETYKLEYDELDPLLRWFELHAQLICRTHLAQTQARDQRELLRRALDTLGAEVIVPLFARGGITGWLFFGPRLTGQPFDAASLEMLMSLSEHVSTVLDNAQRNEEISQQKTLAETLLTAMPPGILACDENGSIRWCNPTAETVLGLNAGEVLNRPIELAGSRIAALLRETLEQGRGLGAQQWVDPNTRRSISVQTRRLLHEGESLGAVAVIQDLTPEESLRQKQELMDRAAFWTDLAASMSHEVRNPLVAIKTFAQLLPERFDDPDFRRDFNEIVVQEIDRLDLIITQINNFAHPPELHFKPIDLRTSMKKAIELVRARSTQNGFSIETTLPDDLPRVVGDETALAEAFAHLVANAAEATSGQPRGRITLSAKSIHEGDHTSGVVVTVHDNGRGISADLREKIFSPFCTTKARGMGLGLPIVKRTVFDHNGRVDVDSNSHGTSVSVLLPVLENGA